MLLFEATKRSLLACEALFARMSAELESLESDIDQGAQISQRGAAPVLSAVAFIDFAHRFGSLADSLPLLNKKKAKMKELRSALMTVEAARNHLQHLRGDLSSNDPIRYPILGAVSWTKGERCFTICFSQSTEMNDLFSIAFDASAMKWTSTLQYQIKDSVIKMDAILTAMRSFYGWLTNVIIFSKPEAAELKWGDTFAVCFRLELQSLSIEGESPR